MKKLISLILLILCVCVTACGKKNVQCEIIPTENSTELSGVNSSTGIPKYALDWSNTGELVQDTSAVGNAETDKTWLNGSIVIDNVKLQVPCSLSDVYTENYTCDEDTSNTILKAYESKVITFKNKLNHTIDCTITNTTNTDLLDDKCVVNSINVRKSSGSVVDMAGTKFGDEWYKIQNKLIKPWLTCQSLNFSQYAYVSGDNSYSVVLYCEDGFNITRYEVYCTSAKMTEYVDKKTGTVD